MTELSKPKTEWTKVKENKALSTSGDTVRKSRFWTIQTRKVNKAKNVVQKFFKSPERIWLLLFGMTCILFIPSISLSQKYEVGLSWEVCSRSLMLFPQVLAAAYAISAAGIMVLMQTNARIFPEHVLRMVLLNENARQLLYLVGLAIVLPVLTLNLSTNSLNYDQEIRFFACFALFTTSLFLPILFIVKSPYPTIVQKAAGLLASKISARHIYLIGDSRFSFWQPVEFPEQNPMKDLCEAACRSLREDNINDALLIIDIVGYRVQELISKADLKSVQTLGDFCSFVKVVSERSTRLGIDRVTSRILEELISMARFLSANHAHAWVHEEMRRLFAQTINDCIAFNRVEQAAGLVRSYMVQFENYIDFNCPSDAVIERRLNPPSPVPTNKEMDEEIVWMNIEHEYFRDMEEIGTKSLEQGLIQIAEKIVSACDYFDTRIIDKQLGDKIKFELCNRSARLSRNLISGVIKAGQWEKHSRIGYFRYSQAESLLKSSKVGKLKTMTIGKVALAVAQAGMEDYFIHNQLGTICRGMLRHAKSNPLADEHVLRICNVLDEIRVAYEKHGTDDAKKGYLQAHVQIRSFADWASEYDAPKATSEKINETLNKFDRATQFQAEVYDSRSIWQM